jgi:hypothetical protein
MGIKRNLFFFFCGKEKEAKRKDASRPEGLQANGFSARAVRCRWGRRGGVLIGYVWGDGLSVA